MLGSPFGAPVEFAQDHSGWSVTLSGARLSFYESPTDLMHLLVGGGVFLSGLGTMMTLVLFGAGAEVFQGLPFVGIGGWFAFGPAKKFLRLASRTTLQVSGHSVRIEQRFAGLRLRRVDLPLAACAGATIEGAWGGVQNLKIDGHRFPVAIEVGVAELLELLHEGAELAAREPDAVPPLPRALAKLRASVQAPDR